MNDDVTQACNQPVTDSITAPAENPPEVQNVTDAEVDPAGKRLKCEKNYALPSCMFSPSGS
jgi:hypothetical protein